MIAKDRLYQTIQTDVSELCDLRVAVHSCTHRQAPVDMGHLGVQVEAEDDEEGPRHDEGTAADKLEEVDPSAGRTHHDGLYADESNK